MAQQAKRLKEGLSGEELTRFCKRYLPESFLSVFSLDNIEYDRIQDRLTQGQATSCIVNTTKASEKGEHWIGVHFTAEGECEYFDSYGLPPIQAETQRLCEMAPSGCYNWNDEPVQDILDDSSAACGFHVLFYLYAKHRDPNLTLHDVVKYYSPDSLRLNDVFAIVFIENKMV